MRKALLIFFIVAIAGCENPFENESEQELWNSLQIRDYQFVYNVACFCGFIGPNPALITVRDGVVTRVEYTSGSSQSGTFPPGGYPTIDSLFAVVGRAEGRNPAKLDVDYDETYHYPRTISIDYRTNVADDEIAYSVSSFTPSSPQLR